MGCMGQAAKKTTIYLDGDVHRALRLKAVEAERTVSDLITEAVRQSLHEDMEDLAAFAERGKEKSLSFGDAVKRLKARGKI